jgi:hypothetical protein
MHEYNTRIDLMLRDELYKVLSKDLSDRLFEEDSFKNIALGVLKHEIGKLYPEKAPGFSYHYSVGGINFQSIVEFLVINPTIDTSILQNFDFNNLVDNFNAILKEAVNASIPVLPIETLNNIISSSSSLRERYRELSSYPEDPNYPDMPIDRGVINALALLSEVGYTTIHSCHGHEHFDTVGIAGAQNPHITLELDSIQYNHMNKIISKFRVDNNVPITLTKQIKNSSGNDYTLEVGDRLIISSLQGAQRANYLQWTLGELNKFVLALYNSQKTDPDGIFLTLIA